MFLSSASACLRNCSFQPHFILMCLAHLRVLRALPTSLIYAACAPSLHVLQALSMRLSILFLRPQDGFAVHQ